MPTQSSKSGSQTKVNTGGGPHIDGGVITGRDFVAGSVYVINIGEISDEELWNKIKPKIEALLAKNQLSEVQKFFEQRLNEIKAEQEEIQRNIDKIEQRIAELSKLTKSEIAALKKQKPIQLVKLFSLRDSQRKRIIEDFDNSVKLIALNQRQLTASKQRMHQLEKRIEDLEKKFSSSVTTEEKTLKKYRPTILAQRPEYAQRVDKRVNALSTTRSEVKKVYVKRTIKPSTVDYEPSGCFGSVIVLVFSSVTTLVFFRIYVGL